MQKIGKSVVWNLILCSGAIWRRREKFEHGCTTTNGIIPYKKPPKHLWKLHGLIDFRWAQTSALPYAFSTTGMNLKVFCGTLYRGCSHYCHLLLLSPKMKSDVTASVVYSGSQEIEPSMPTSGKAGNLSLAHENKKDHKSLGGPLSRNIYKQWESSAVTTASPIYQWNELTLKLKANAQVLGIAPLNWTQHFEHWTRRFTTVEVVSDWHWL